MGAGDNDRSLAHVGVEVRALVGVLRRRAVRARAAVGEKGEGGRPARVFIGGRLRRTRKGAGRADWLPSLQVRRTGGFHSGVRHYRDGGRKAHEGERKGRWGTDVRASCHSERKGEPVAVRVRR